jgi:predicted metal-dependent hydrolase
VIDSNAQLPEHRIRVSPRAKHPRLRVSADEGLVVVIPPRFPASKVPEMLRAHAAWIERAMEKTAERRSHIASGAEAMVPQRVELPGIGIAWDVVLRETDSRTVRATVSGDRLLLSGAVGDREACVRAARSAIGRAARELLPLMLGGVEAETGWAATKVSVRRQKTRWGSCSARKAISLNESLAFLPPVLVRHVLVHELAHTERLDHSAAFWSLVARHDAAWREHRRELRDGWRHVPGWFVARDEEGGGFA